MASHSSIGNGATAELPPRPHFTYGGDGDGDGDGDGAEVQTYLLRQVPT